MNELIDELMNKLKEEDSELWFVKKWITYYINRIECPLRLSHKIWLAAHFVWSHLPVSHFVYKKSGLRRIFFNFVFINWVAFDLKFFVLSTNLSVVNMIRTPILSDHNDMICTTQYSSKCQTTNHFWNQTSWDTSRTTPFQFQNSL